MFHFKVVQDKDGLYRYIKGNGSLSKKGYKTSENLLRYELLKRKWLTILILMIIFIIWILLTPNGI